MILQRSPEPPVNGQRDFYEPAVLASNFLINDFEMTAAWDTLPLDLEEPETFPPAGNPNKRSWERRQAFLPRQERYNYQ
jgi:hypothetical protein